MAEQWRIECSGDDFERDYTILEGDEVVAVMMTQETAEQIVADHGASAREQRLERAIREIICDLYDDVPATLRMTKAVDRAREALARVESERGNG